MSGATAVSVAALRSDPQYASLKEYVLDHTGLSYYSDKDEDFATRLARRITARKTDSCAAYLMLLKHPQWAREEMDRLVGELTIGETYFFRQHEHFDLLRHTILPDLLERNRTSKMLRIWSAGCATGAEPYSLSLLLQEEFHAQLTGWNVSILATDINVDFLARAQEARFPAWALRATSAEVKERCFTKDGALWILRPEFRRGVTFRYHNLASEADLAASGRMFDLILCRNVLIYFSRQQTVTVLDQFHRCLAPGGWLLVGYAEPNRELFKGFETVSTAEATAYRRASGESSERVEEPVWQPYAWPDHKTAEELPPAPVDLHVVRKPTHHEPAPAAAVPTVPVTMVPVPTVDDVRILADSGHWDEATRLGARLIASDALNPASHYTVALIHEHLGQLQEARHALLKAIYLDREFALAHYNLGTLLQSTREVEPARRALRNTLEILDHLPQEESLPHGDSITAGELRALTIMHLNMMQGNRASR